MLRFTGQLHLNSALLHMSSHSRTQAEVAATTWNMLTLWQKARKHEAKPNYAIWLKASAWTQHVHSHCVGQSKSHSQVRWYIPPTGITPGRNIFHLLESLLKVTWHKVWMYNALIERKKIIADNNTIHYTKKQACARTMEHMTNLPVITEASSRADRRT